MQETELLRIRARERITQGRLPRTKALRTWGGLGVGLPCNLCDAAILGNEPEFELQFDVSSSSSPLRFHRQCHAVWNEVREEYRPPEWRRVSEELPPSGALVDARVSLAETRSIILSVICSSGPDPAACSWINATTGGPLPTGWNPVEWRHPSGRSNEADRTSEPRRRHDPLRSDEPRRSTDAAAEPHEPPLPRRA